MPWLGIEGLNIIILGLKMGKGILATKKYSEGAYKRNQILLILN